MKTLLERLNEGMWKQPMTPKRKAILDVLKKKYGSDITVVNFRDWDDHPEDYEFVFEIRTENYSGSKMQKELKSYSPLLKLINDIVLIDTSGAGDVELFKYKVLMK